MDRFLDRLPSWLRWLLLLPAVLFVGFLVGLFVHLTNSAQAVRPDAPIVFIGEFAAGTLSVLAALHVANAVTPYGKRATVIAFIALQVIASIWALQLDLGHDDMAFALLSVGNLVGCLAGWWQLIRKPAPTRK